MIVTAVLSATVAAVISPDRVDTLFSWLWPGNGDSATLATLIDEPTSTLSAQPPELKIAGHPNGTIFAKVPVSWQVSASNPDAPIAGEVYVGEAMAAGTNVHVIGDVTSPRLYVLASADAAEGVGIAAMSTDERSEWARDEVRLADYTVDGCKLVGEQALDNASLDGSVRMWQGCFQLEGMRQWDIIGTTADGSAVVVGQLVLTNQEDDGLAVAIMASISIAVEKLPQEQGHRSGDLVTP